MAGETILIVDDNPSNLKLIKLTLSGLGYDLHTATDGDDVLGQLTRIKPALILMGLQLPGMDGLALTRRIKADPIHRKAVVFAMTSHALSGDRERALAAGCDGHLASPIDTHELPELVAAALAARKPGSSA